MPTAAVSSAAHASPLSSPTVRSRSSPFNGHGGGDSAPRDSLFVRYVGDKKPHLAAWGKKGSAWEDTARAVNAATGAKWTGMIARNRLTYLLDRYDRFRVGKQTGTSLIRRLDQDVLPILHETLFAVAQVRTATTKENKNQSQSKNKNKNKENVLPAIAVAKTTENVPVAGQNKHDKVKNTDKASVDAAAHKTTVSTVSTVALTETKNVPAAPPAPATPTVATEATATPSTTTVTLAKTREDKTAARARRLEAKLKVQMKERDEKRAAAVVAAAAAARARENGAVATHTATAVAKRRKRKGVKTKEQKRATASASVTVTATTAMFDALRQSREEYLNQLRVQTAAHAAFEATATVGSPPPSRKATKARTLSTVDLDLVLLRAVAKLSPFSQNSKQQAEAQWLAVAERVMQDCNLKFTPTGIRDRCDALIRDFEANACKRSTFTSGVVVADEERASLLRVIRKAHHRHARDDHLTDAGRLVASQDAAIEIEDEQTEENDELGEEREEEEEGEGDMEEWGALEENAVEEEVSRDEQVEDSQVEEEEEEEEDNEEDLLRQKGVHGSQQSVVGSETSASTVVLPLVALGKRRHNRNGTSPDADPAVGMSIEELQLDGDSPDSSESQDFTPRKYKERRLDHVEQAALEVVAESEERIDLQPPTDLGDDRNGQTRTVIDVIYAARHERRAEFKAILELMQQQNSDHRREWDREHARRLREQDQRQREMASLVDLLAKERKDRKSEVVVMLEALNKEREDRRGEFKSMMALMTRLVENATSAPQPRATSS